jgi:hypothetical protein
MKSLMIPANYITGMVEIRTTIASQHNVGTVHMKLYVNDEQVYFNDHVQEELGWVVNVGILRSGDQWVRYSPFGGYIIYSASIHELDTTFPVEVRVECEVISGGPTEVRCDELIVIYSGM